MDLRPFIEAAEDNCQDAVFSNQRETTLLPESLKMLAGPATPQQRLGSSTAMSAGISAARAATTTTFTMPSEQRGPNFTPTGLAVLTNFTAGDKLSDTRVWVAGLQHSPHPPSSAPFSSFSASFCSSAAAHAERGAVTGAASPVAPPHHNHNHQIPTLDSNGPRQSIIAPYHHNHHQRRGDDAICPAVQDGSATVAAAQAVAAAPSGSPVATAPCGRRRGGHLSGAPSQRSSSGSRLDTATTSTSGSSSGAAPCPPTLQRAHAPSAATTSSLGQVDATGGPSPWSDAAAAAISAVPLPYSVLSVVKGGSGGASWTAVVGTPEEGKEDEEAGRGEEVQREGKEDGEEAAAAVGEEGEQVAPLLSTYVAAMPSAGIAPLNEDIRVASKRQRSASDGLWPAAAAAPATATAAASAPRPAGQGGGGSGHRHHPPSPAPPAQHASQDFPAPVSAAAATAATASTTGSNMLILPSPLPMRRITQQQQQLTLPYSHHPLPSSHAHQQQQQQLGRRQSWESYRLPLVSVGGGGGGGGGGTPTAASVINSPALSDRCGGGAGSGGGGVPSYRVVPTPSLTRDVPRIEVSDISDNGSEISEGGDEATCLRLPPLQPSYSSHFKIIRASVDGDLGPRPRQPGHSLFTDSNDEFDGWMQHATSHPYSPHGGPGRSGVPAWLRNQPPFLQCRSGPAPSGGGGDLGIATAGGGGGGSSSEVMAGLVSQLRASSCSSACGGRSPPTAMAAAVAAAAAATGSVDSGGYGGGGLSSPSLRTAPGAPWQPSPPQQQQVLRDAFVDNQRPQSRVRELPLMHSTAVAPVARAVALSAVPSEGSTSVPPSMACAASAVMGPGATASAPLSPAGSVTAAAMAAPPSPPAVAAAAQKLQAWASAASSAAAAAHGPASQVLPALSSPRAHAGTATVAAPQHASATPSPPARLSPPPAQPKPAAVAPGEHSPSPGRSTAIIETDTAVARRRHPVPPPMPPLASRSRRGLLSALSEESAAAAAAAAAAAMMATTAMTSGN